MNIKKRTKVIATIGPSINNKSKLLRLVQKGVNVFRINFSHNTHEVHEKSISLIRQINKEYNLNIAILADLQGPKIRTGEVKLNSILVKNQSLILTTQYYYGDVKKIQVLYRELINDVKPNDKILIDDGKIKLKVEKKLNDYEVKTTIVRGGPISSKKGVNLPDSKVSIPSLTKKDKKDLAFILQHNISWIALSFVRKEADIIELKKKLEKENSNSKIIAKIEKPEAIKNLEKIISVSDGVMVARGDLGVEIPIQRIPIIQKNIIKLCQKYSKPSIIATQLLESMLNSTMPARSDINDIANAVIDGADALMLSGETSIGNFPVESVHTMINTIIESEKYSSIYYQESLPNFSQADSRIITDSICYNSCRLAQRVKASAIVTMSFSGYTGFKLSGFRPKSKIFVFTGNKDILNMLSLVWGVEPFYYDKFTSTDDTIHEIMEFLKDKQLVKKEEYIVNIASMPISKKGQSNMMKLSKVN